MGDKKEWFEICINGLWCPVILAGAAKDCSFGAVWNGLENEYGKGKVRYIREV